MSAKEEAICFNCNNHQLIGIIHHPYESKVLSTAVLIVVGGPQTRVGSHRQFVLLARELAKNGIPCMRFDYRGMGDSEGEQIDFLDVTSDIDVAVQQCLKKFNVKQVVIWGLCDAASSAMIFVKNKPSAKISGLVLLNPWVHTEQGKAAVIVKHYYLKRLLDKSFWQKVFCLKFNVWTSIVEFFENIKKMCASFQQRKNYEEVTSETSNQQNYIEHMLQGLQCFPGRVLLITSGNDLTATEFWNLVSSSPAWQQAVEDKIDKQYHISDATHTFSSAVWRSEVAKVTINWLLKR